MEPKYLHNMSHVYVFDVNMDHFVERNWQTMVLTVVI